jgi:adenylate cyclase
MLAVGFADLCGFTNLSQRLSAKELDQLLGRFESVVGSTVDRHRGRVVKLMGDEVLFVAEEPHAVATIGLELASRASIDALLPGLRIGAAYGSVLVRRGDCFGTTVNLASRVMHAAPCGQVLVDENLHALVRDAPEIATALHGVLDLKDFAETALWRISRSRRAASQPSGIRGDRAPAR